MRDILLRPVEAAAFPFVRLGARVFHSARLRAVLDHLKVRRAFRPRWTRRSLRDALRLLGTIDRVLTTAGVPYMTYAGTLLGAHRHGGVVPWDDDFDLCLSGEDLPSFLKLKDAFGAEGIAIVEANGCHKLFWADRNPIDATTTWSWPFVDIFVWDGAGSRIVMRNFEDHYPFDAIHPLGRAPFHDLQLPIPRDPEAVLQSWYGPGFMGRAISPNYNHRREKIEPIRLITSVYPLPRWRRVLSRRKPPTRMLNEMLLRAAMDFLKKCGVEWWLDYGTLLGAHRTKGLLPYEEDVDLSVMEDAYPILQREAHRLDSAYEFYDTSSRHDGPKCGIMHRRLGGNCDFYTYRRLDNDDLRICLGEKWHGTMDARDIPADLIFPLEPTRIDEFDAMRPHRTREYLEHRYGYIGYPAVLKDDGSGHYRSVWKQDPWRENDGAAAPALP